MTKQVQSKYDLIDPDWRVYTLGSEIYDRYKRSIRDWNRQTAFCPIRENNMRLLQNLQGYTLQEANRQEARKSRAIRFIASEVGFQSKCIHYAENPGNDLEALLSGISSTLADNAPSFIRSAILSKARTQTSTNVYLARACYGNGFIEGFNAHGFGYPEIWRFGTCE